MALLREEVSESQQVRSASARIPPRPSRSSYGKPAMPTPPDSVTEWICQLQAGKRQAIQNLWERYYPRMVELARRHLRGVPRRAADEEDVVLAAFDSFCRGVEAGRYPDLRDRSGLWQVLLSMTVNKAVDLIRHAGRDKRDWRRTVTQSELEEGFPGSDAERFEAMLHSDEPDPAFASEIADQLEWLLRQLNDEQLRQIALFKLQGYTNAEIASHLGCAVSTVERRLVLVRKLLEAEYGGRTEE